MPHVNLSEYLLQHLKIFGKEAQKVNTALFHIATLIAEVGYFINSDT